MLDLKVPEGILGKLSMLPRLLERPDPPRTVSLVVQKEVAERWVQAGDWSLATLGVRVYGRPELTIRVPRSAFLPEPRVDSALVRITPDAEPAVPRPDLASFFQFVTPFFQARRKQLTFVLGRRRGIGGTEARARLSVIGIDPSRRAETLTLDEWRRLFENEREQ